MNQLMTKWGSSLDPSHVHEEYPRPLMVRKQWQNLNGYWEYAISQNEQEPADYDGRILVPFAPESNLSGVGKQLLPGQTLWYRRTFCVDESAFSDQEDIGEQRDTSEQKDACEQRDTDKQGNIGDQRNSDKQGNVGEGRSIIHAPGRRVLLHFGAVDQSCSVRVNGKEVISHTGGYLPFTADITDALLKGDSPCINAGAGASTIVESGDSNKAGDNPHSKFGGGTSVKTGDSPCINAGAGASTIVESGDSNKAGDSLHSKAGASTIDTPVNNTLVVCVHDDSDTSYHARGKQKLERGGMFYTATSGIWQSVWIEYVSEIYITELKTTPDIDRGTVTLTVKTNAGKAVPAKLCLWKPALYNGEREEILPKTEKLLSADIMTETPVEVPLEDLRLWTCDEPWLYTCSVSLKTMAPLMAVGSDAASDSVFSYFAMRSFTLEQKDFPRICLNHQFVFQKGVLDQGYWPDGLLTPPSDEAIIFDLLAMKKTGFNMVRKHIKIESGRWYSHCDRLGLIVWQDMVNGGGPLRSWYVTYLATAFSILRIRMPDRPLWLMSRQNLAGREEFVREMKETIHLLENHPSICTWVIFNEGWGQFETRRMTNIVRQEDPSRLIDQASGWYDQGGGDMRSIHNYFTRLSVWKDVHRANVLSEFGGKALIIPEHSCSGDLYGYGMMKDREELNDAYRNLDNEMTALIVQGLCASVYTQWTDIEDEVNGIYTYDREVRKIDG